MNKTSIDDETIRVLLANWEESEDELENSDDENEIKGDDDYLIAHDDNNVDGYLDIENMQVDFEFDFEQGNSELTYAPPPVNITPHPLSPTPPPVRQIYRPVRHTPPVELKNMKWKNGSLVFNENTRPHINVPLSNDIYQLDTPLQFFSLFFTDELYSNIQKETELFSVQKDPSKPIGVTIAELKRYVGICVYSSVIHVPKVRDYWSAQLGFAPIYNALSQKRFEAIRAVLHFNNNENMLPRFDPNFDRLFKLRPLVEYLNNQFGKVPYSRDLSLDEQMCSTKARNILKQYMPNKPHKWGYKLFVLCDFRGYSYNLEIYTGQENDPKFRQGNDIDIGASGNVVVRLTKNVPNYKNHRIYFDNYYTSIPLMAHLFERGILALGTVRRNRVPNNQLPDEKLIKKKERGFITEKVSSYNSTPLSLSVWKDNKIVTLLSTYAGAEPITTIKRFDRQSKTRVDVNCPYVVKEYNRFMGGVDLLDGLIGRYKIKLRSRKWYIRLWYHLIDVSIVNSWLLYKRCQIEKGESVSYTLAEWRSDIGSSLTKTGVCPPTRGRRSNSLEALIKKVNKTRPTAMPTKDTRMDNTGHLPSPQAKRGRCKVPLCKGFTYFKCIKCNCYICVARNKDCFEKFHTK